MTAIVGFVDANKTVWIGGDSAGISGLSLTVRADAKVFVRKGFIFGFTSSFRMGQLIRYKLNPPDIGSKDLHEYMATDFVDSLRDCLKSGGYATKQNDVESGGVFLVGVRGRLFRIGSDYQVGEAHSSYDACGCGEDLANGVMFVLTNDQRWERHPETIINLSLRAAEHHNAGVCAPFVIKSLPFERDDERAA